MILRRIVKIVATKCQILRLKCTKIDFWPALPQTFLDLRGPTSKGRGYRKGGKGEEAGEGMGGEAGGGEEGGRDGKGGKEERGGDPVCIFKFSLE